jgi:Cys-tRNA(Pro)/Cys-tRNA(Cys) deacylase
LIFISKRIIIKKIKIHKKETIMKKEEKTNVMRLLDGKKINYQSYNYVSSGVVSGIEVASVLEQDPNKVFKTLVTESGTKKNYVFLVPVERELDLKKCAKAVGEKSIAMIKSKELLPLTGYIHGGCSPIGMKKQFVTVIDSSALNFETIIFSGGKIGYQVEVSMEDLKKIVPFKTDDITV